MLKDPSLHPEFTLDGNSQRGFVLLENGRMLMQDAVSMSVIVTGHESLCWKIVEVRGPLYQLLTSQAVSADEA